MSAESPEGPVNPIELFSSNKDNPKLTVIDYEARAVLALYLKELCLLYPAFREHFDQMHRDAIAEESALGLDKNSNQTQSE